MHTYISTAALLWVGCVNACLAQQPIATLDDIITGLQRSASAFVDAPSWTVHYTQRKEAFSLPPGFTSETPDSEFTNAQKGELLYSYQKQQGDPPQEFWVAWRDHVCTHRQLNGNYDIFPEIHPRLFSSWTYTHNLFVNTYLDTHAFRSRALISSFGAPLLSDALWFSLPRSIERKPLEWSIRPATEAIDGFPCTVAVRTVDGATKDVIWIDRENGHLCRQRQFFYAPTKLGMEWKNEQAVEQLPGLWLPMRQIHKLYNNESSAADLQGKLRYTTTNDVIKISFSLLADDFFVAPVIKDGIVADAVRGETFLVQPGTSDPERLAARAIADSSFQTREMPLGRSSGLHWMLLVNAIGILGTLFVLQLVRFSRNRHRTRLTR